MSGQACWAVLGLALMGAVGLAGCSDDDINVCSGSGDPEELRGSFCEGSEIEWDTVELGWFAAAESLRIRYGVQETNRVSPRFEIQLLGQLVQLVEGQSIELRRFSFVRRWPEGATEAQDLTMSLADQSRLIFDRLDLQVGGQATGEFDLLISGGRTLRGRFSGSLRDLSPPSGD